MLSLKECGVCAEKSETMQDANGQLVSDPQAWALRQRVTSTCAICGASFEALAPEAFAWFAEHRKRKHPNLPEPQSRRSGTRTVKAPQSG